MENITFYDFITFVVDFVGLRFLFWNLFYSFLKHRKNMTFMTLNGPTDDNVFKVFWKTETVSQNTVEPRLTRTTTKIHKNLALRPSRHLDQIAAVSWNALVLIKVKPWKKTWMMMRIKKLKAMTIFNSPRRRLQNIGRSHFMRETSISLHCVKSVSREWNITAERPHYSADMKPVSRADTNLLET